MPSALESNIQYTVQYCIFDRQYQWQWQWQWQCGIIPHACEVDFYPLKHVKQRAASGTSESSASFCVSAEAAAAIFTALRQTFLIYTYFCKEQSHFNLNQPQH
jgi:hypothetical protein